MIYVRLKGGMGNQMFQYAYGRRLAHELNTELVMDLAALLNRNLGPDYIYRNYDLSIFQIEEKFILPPGLLSTLYRIKNNRLSNLLNRWSLRAKEEVREPNFRFNQQLIDNARNGQLHNGWFQSPKYFAPIEAEIRDAFRFRDPIIPESDALAQRIRSTQAVCLNVRRTDFLQNAALNATNLNYFEDAAAYVAERVKQPHFFIFSDDVDWCRDHIRLDHPTEVIGHEHKGRKFGNYLQLMTLCSHFIIPNSSFAWWGAWLSGREQNKMVVTPDPWFAAGDADANDLLPDQWVKLSVKK